MNMAYLLELPADAFVARARTYFEKQGTPVTIAALAADAAYFREVMLISQPKIKGLEELPAYTGYFFTDDFAVDAKVRDKVMGKGDPKARLAELGELAASADFSSDIAIESALKALAESKGLGFGDYQSVARLAVSGTNVGPSITSLFRVLGRDRVKARLAKLASA